MSGEPPAGSGVIAACLAGLTVLRGVAAFLPGMWWWGIDALRFVPPLPGWALWAAGAAACVPAIARRALGGLDRAGDIVTRPRGAWIVAAAGAALVWALPDRAWFLGDYLLRLGALLRGEHFASYFPQALPLDVFLHGWLPESLLLRSETAFVTFHRLVGALEAGAFAWLAVEFARVLEARRALASAVIATVFLGGTLTVFTGFGKSASELCVIAAAIGVFGVSCLRANRGLTRLNLAVATGLVLHRSALLFLPALIVVWVLWARRHRGERVWTAPRTLLALALPVAALAWSAPRMITVLSTFDLPFHFTPSLHGAPSGVWSAAFGATNLADAGNLLVALAPLVILLPALAILHARNGSPRSEALPLWVLAASFVPALLFAHPQQGLFRDWDVFAPAGVAFSLLVAWLLVEGFRGAAGRAWVLVPVVFAAFVPSTQWLLHANDVDRGIARARAFAAGPPLRNEARRAQLLDYVGLRTLRLARFDEATDAFQQSAALVPQPRVLHEWALAAVLAEDYPAAREAYRLLLARKPDDAIGWLGMAGVSFRLRDTTMTRVALERLHSYSGDPRAVAAIEDYLRAFPQVWPDSLPAIGTP